MPTGALSQHLLATSDSTSTLHSSMLSLESSRRSSTSSRSSRSCSPMSECGHVSSVSERASRYSYYYFPIPKCLPGSDIDARPSRTNDLLCVSHFGYKEPAREANQLQQPLEIFLSSAMANVEHRCST